MITNFQTYTEAQFIEMAMRDLSGTALFEGGRLVGLYKAEIMKPALEKNDREGMMKSVLGVASYRRNYIYHTNETTGIAAEQGYGPLLYLLLMHISPNGLIPNRVAEDVNTDAKKVWQQFVEGAGKNFVTAETLGIKHHTEPYLNLKFRLRMPLSGVADAEHRHLQVIGYDQYAHKSNRIAQVLEQYLGLQLRKVYPEVAEIMKL